jgi:(heptosyl)LPS beta-1,4-glucosyltransferase
VIGLALVVVARDEAEHLPACLASAAGVDEVVVVDHDSRDDTAEVARRFGARVVAGEGALGALRALGTSLATHEWVLMIDADERLPADGVEGIRAAIRSSPPPVVAFTLPIRTHVGAYFLRWAGYYPARRVRVFRRAAAVWDPAQRVHERPRFPRGSRLRALPIALDHFSYRDIAHARAKSLRYAALAAEGLRARGRRPKLVAGAVRAAWRWCRAYVLRGGFLMGRVGWALAHIQAEAVWKRTKWARNGVPRGGLE